jgi:hypothetical protein
MGILLLNLPFLLVAQTGEFDSRLVIQNVDCSGSTLYADLEIKASSAATIFRLGSANFRFTFNDEALSNPRIEQELTVTGFIFHPGGFSFYNPHNLNGSIGSIVSYNLVFISGLGYPLDESAWVGVGRIAFDIDDLGACFDLHMNSQIPADFPNTVVAEVISPTSQPAVPGNSFLGANGCFSSYCGSTNQAPVAVDDFAQTIINNAVSGNLLTNDSDPDGDNLALALAPVSGPSNGSVTFLSDGSFTYTPNAGFQGTDMIQYSVCDDGTPSLCSNANLTVTVLPCPGIPASPAAILGSQAIEKGTSTMFFINPVAGATGYTWSVPAGWTIDLGQGTTSITVSVGAGPGQVCVSADGACGSSAFTCISVLAYTKGVYDLRFVTYDFDCATQKLYLDVEIKSNGPLTNFKLGGQNYRFVFNKAVLANPVIDQELTISGVIPTGLNTTIYGPHTLTGSLDSIVSYNVPHLAGEGYSIDDLTWTSIGRLSFDVLDQNGCAELDWLKQEDFPATTISEIVKGLQPEANGGQYEDFLFCLSTACKPGINPQAINTATTSPLACGKDNFENNDIQSASISLNTGMISGLGTMLICPQGDVDWYSTQVNLQGRTLSVNLGNLPANYNVELYDNFGLLATSAQSGNNSENIQIANAPTGTYFIKVYGEAGAWNPTKGYSLSVTQMIPAPTGTTGTKPLTGSLPGARLAEGSMAVYPNPASGTAMLELTGNAEGILQVEMLDMTGKSVSRIETAVSEGSNTIPLNISGLTAGTYIVRAFGSNVAMTSKLVVMQP